MRGSELIPVQILQTRMDGDQVVFEMACPREVFRPLVATLTNLSELTHVLQHKKKIASAGIPPSPEIIAAREEYKRKFEKRVIKLHKVFVADGLSPKEAVSETNRAMKQDGFGNCSYEIVLSLVRSAGLLRSS